MTRSTEEKEPDKYKKFEWVLDLHAGDILIIGICVGIIILAFSMLSVALFHYLQHILSI